MQSFAVCKIHCAHASNQGKPVWILLAEKADWRWLLERNETPWYSTAKLFRQKEQGNWEPCLQKIYQELSALL